MRMVRTICAGMTTTLLCLLFFGAIHSAAAAAPSTERIEQALPRPVPPASRWAQLNPFSPPAAQLDVEAGMEAEAIIVPRGTITERMTYMAQADGADSPFYRRTWLTYYGRPGIEQMGILGEYEVDELTPLLRRQAKLYDRANGESLSVMPAFHLVYGMATVAPGDDNSHLAYLDDRVVMDYIEMAQEEEFAVILDVQIGALAPVVALSPTLPFLEYEHVHLAIDPEFAMSHKGQYVPGNPIGFVTAQQVNDVQESIQAYLTEHDLPGKRILLIHQFQETMIVDADQIDAGYEQVAPTFSVDGWGGPWAKISKYNAFVTPESSYSAFKLFYQWDEPLLAPTVALGERRYAETDLIIDVTPNMIIYQ